MILVIVVLAIIGLVFIFSSKKGGPATTSSTITQNKKSANIFENMTDLCNTLTKEQVSELVGKMIVKTVPLTSGTLHSCQYYLTDTQALIINNDFLNVENQKKGHEALGRKITTNLKIPMENFIVIQEDGLINEIYLVLGPNNYVSINRTSAKTLTEEEVVLFAEKLAGVITGKTPLTKSIPPTPTESKTVVPLPQETDIIHSFFNLIEEKRSSEAVGMMNVNNDSQKQAWAVQFNAITSIKVSNVEPSMPEEWSDTKHTYKVTMDVKMNPNSANQPIPYYGWENGNNTKWITIEKAGNLWKVNGIASGP